MAIFVVVLLVAACLSMLLLLPMLGMPDERHSLVRLGDPLVIGMVGLTAILGYAVLGITVGQLCSMVFRSGILAAFFGLLLTIVLVWWCGMMHFWGISWLWSAAPIPVVLLLATRVRTRNWLLERNTLRAWLPMVLVLAIPALAILTVVPLYRVYQIPAVDPGFSPAELERPITPEETATLELYQKASQTLVPLRRKEPAPDSKAQESDAIKLTSEEIAWVDANPEPIALAMKASRGDLHLRAKDVAQGSRIPRLADLLLDNGSPALQQAGRLDAALQRYLAVIRIASQLRSGWWYYPTPDMIERKAYVRLLDWSTAPGQKPEQIISAARQIEALTADLPIGKSEIEIEYLRTRKALGGDLSAVAGPKAKIPATTIVWLHLPWEHARALRLLNLLTRNELDELSRAETAAHEGQRIPQPPSRWVLPREPAYAIRQTIYAPPIEYGVLPAGDLVRQYAAVETLRRATAHYSGPRSVEARTRLAAEEAGRACRQVSRPLAGRPLLRPGVSLFSQWTEDPAQLVPAVGNGLALRVKFGGHNPSRHTVHLVNWCKGRIP